MVERLIRPSETQEDREVHTMSRMTRVLFKAVKHYLHILPDMHLSMLARSSG